MNKRGLLLLKQIIEIIVAIAVILILLYASTILFRTYFGKQDEMQAQGTLDSLIQELNSLEEAEVARYTLLAPKGWYVVAFDEQHNINENFQKPTTLFQKNVLCVCKKKCESKLCRVIELPLKQEEKPANIKIEIVDIWLAHQIDHYEVSKIELAVVGVKLSEEEKVDVNFAYNKMKTKEWDSELASIVEKYYSQYQLSNYIANKEEFEKIIRAIIIQESLSVEDAIGCDGEVGLMQIMPQTAKLLGLSVPDYGTEDISQLSPCMSEKRTSISICNKVHPENCNKEEDERFNPIKNIDAGTRFLAERIAEFQNQWLGIAAYNTGSGGVRNNCEPLTITGCPSTFAGRIYAEKIRAKMELI
ncbi:MAG: lytic transglycosylase domain-containing protein [Candidatus Pacearchaeota archaeon]|nr:MAG: lytic transglycosylase domain-containing protein [Candidatus Pacearchaeota archaeon]